MNAWLVATLALLLSIVPCGIVCVRRSPADAVVGLEASATLVALALMTLSVGSGRSIYGIVAIVTAGLTLAGGMAFARFLDRLG
ncbi:MAG TPA: monovalent cation/H+ antiporter complex subunit F [Actinomycetota bacterium]|jgi:multicomponent Na+:H+ antiporter subunit F|nr:monovalent cation/H+ antiporter complex subunit F [Actinomycetota bacterium]